MNKYLLSLSVLVGLLFGAFPYASAQQNPMLTGTLHSETPPAKSIPAGSSYVDVAMITLTASGGDVYLNGIYLDTNVSGGLSNFTNVYLYNTTDYSMIGAYPTQSENPNLIQFSPVTIGSNMTVTYLVRVTLAASAAGQIRIGFSDFTFATQAEPVLAGIPIYGNVMTLPGPTPTPTPTVTPTPTATPTPSPTSTPTPAGNGFTTLAALGLQEGDTVSATGSADPDIYIVNDYGYKRLFLNPVIFNFYGHLGGFSNVNTISVSTRNMLVTSGLFRNCETNDPRVYGLEVTGEDTGTLHWINTTGDQAVADDPEFFKKVFCINNNEFSWYHTGSVYTSVSQVPSYSR